MEPVDNPSQPLRIALVTETFPPEVNGVAMTLGRLTAGLLQQGHTVQLVRPRQGASDEDDAGATATLEQVRVRGIPIPRYTDLQFGLPAARRLRKLWREQRPVHGDQIAGAYHQYVVHSDLVGLDLRDLPV